MSKVPPSLCQRPNPTQRGKLYDHAKDLGETTNFIRQHSEIAAELKQLLDHLESTGRSRP